MFDVNETIEESCEYASGEISVNAPFNLFDRPPPLCSIEVDDGDMENYPSAVNLNAEEVRQLIVVLERCLPYLEQA